MMPVVPSVGGKGGGKNKLMSDMPVSSSSKPGKAKITGSLKKNPGKAGPRKKG